MNLSLESHVHTHIAKLFTWQSLVLHRIVLAHESYERCLPDSKFVRQPSAATRATDMDDGAQTKTLFYGMVFSPTYSTYNCVIVFVRTFNFKKKRRRLFF